MNQTQVSNILAAFKLSIRNIDSIATGKIFLNGGRGCIFYKALKKGGFKIKYNDGPWQIARPNQQTR